MRKKSHMTHLTRVRSCPLFHDELSHQLHHLQAVLKQGIRLVNVSRRSRRSVPASFTKQHTQAPELTSEAAGSLQ
jgi:hypothetical protein